MPLKLRPTGLASGFYKDSVDYDVFCGKWCIGRIYENHSGPENSFLAPEITPGNSSVSGAFFGRS